MRWKRTIVLAALLPAVPTPAQTPLPDSTFVATGKWAIDYADKVCSLSKALKNGSGSATLGIKPYPFSNGGDIILMVDRPTSAMPRLSKGRVAVGAAKPITTDLETFASADHKTLIFIWSEHTLLEDLAHDDQVMLTLSPDSGKPFAISIVGAPAAIKALRVCQDDLLTSWGIDPQANAKAATRAIATSNPASWFTSADYPRAAQMKGAIGTVRLMFRIKADGSVDDCRVVGSSGTPELDMAACTGVTSRARFLPARDASGAPTAMYGTRSIRYRF